MKKPHFALLPVFMCTLLFASDARQVIELNGTWAFEQTETAWPPETFSRTIPVPGLIHLADPPIDQYDRLYPRSGESEIKEKYEPRYNWYKKNLTLPEHLKDKQAVLTLLKSKFVTQVIVNGIDFGTHMQCYTPVECDITKAVKFGGENEILIRVGDWQWLPDASPGSMDYEKKSYLSGIWDDVSIVFTGKDRLHRMLLLPSVRNKQILAKFQLRNFFTWPNRNKRPFPAKLRIRIQEKKSGKVIVPEREHTLMMTTGGISETELIIPFENGKFWTPDDPFLYLADVALITQDTLRDRVTEHFGYRELSRKGRRFTLNGDEWYMRGSNICLHRFFEDPECVGLPWDRKWVQKLLIDIPKKLSWNGQRTSLGLVPEFWYDMADAQGMTFQNEWAYWHTHGWNEQIRREYIDWIWTDGNHPSIVVWDLLNENNNVYMARSLVPELKKIDPYRLFDEGHDWNEEHKYLSSPEMDEPHLYRIGANMDRDTYAQFVEKVDTTKYPLGDLQDWPAFYRNVTTIDGPSIVNEYGWIWLWRDGSTTRLSGYHYRYFIGETSTVEQRRQFQSYYEQLQCEWIRANRDLAGILSFCYLTNNYGFTGDFFIDKIKELNPSPALKWAAHSFAPSAVFIDLVDGRYMKHVEPFKPNEQLHFNLIGVNDLNKDAKGDIVLKLMDANGKIISKQKLDITIPFTDKRIVPTGIQLPETPGGYLILTEYTPDHDCPVKPVISRRYIKVGKLKDYNYYEFQPDINF